MNIPEEPDQPAQINIVPMIDVIFAILAFFVLSTLFLTRSEGLPVNLPQAENSTQNQAAGTKRLTVTIDAQGNLSLNRQPLSLSDLVQAITAEGAQGQPVLVILNADETARHGQVIAVMDQLKGIPQVRLAIATTRPSTSPRP